MEKLFKACPQVFQLEKIASGKSELEKILKGIGIAFYPRLANDLFDEKINRNKSAWKPYMEWSVKEKSQFDHILGDLRQQLGYEPRLDTPPPPGILGRLLNVLHRRYGANSRKLVKSRAITLESGVPDNPYVHGAEFEFNKALIIRATGGHNAYLVLKGSHWDKRVDFSGWELSAGAYCSLAIKYTKKGGDSRLYSLFYDKNGNLLDKRLCAYLRDSQGVVECEFRPDTGTRYLDLAVYMAKGDSATELSIENVQLVARPV
jgi:hypothetical protein